MLTRLTLRNFKRFGSTEIELGNPVVFIGPNNSGKTTALQALALWSIGLKRWTEKRGGKPAPEKRPGVTINRRDLIAVPVPSANLLWRDLHVRNVETVGGKPVTQNIRIDVVVEGVSSGRPWTCGLEFDYANEESFFCRPLRLSEEKNPPRMPVPAEAEGIKVAFLPPMSGLSDREFVKQAGEVGYLIGQGRTAEVLRNLCNQLVAGREDLSAWNQIQIRMKKLFGIDLEAPNFIPERSEIEMTYRDPKGVRLDLSSAGRGVHQTLLLLAYIEANRGAVLLLDEPDAHLEILRQRQVYELLTRAAEDQGNQIIAASHSEVILNEAADRDVVVAFVGSPHRIDDRGQQLVKSLKAIGFEQYYQAEQTGWVLYLEGSTDLAILQAFAERLGHPAVALLERPFVHYVQNQPPKVYEHFFGLREARADLAGVALFDRLDRPAETRAALRQLTWRRREIESYLCQPETLLAFARESAVGTQAGPLFEAAEESRREGAMQESIADIVPRLALADRNDPWWSNVKASEEYLDRVFSLYFGRLGLPNLMRKTDYHRLARFVTEQQLDPEVRAVLDEIATVAGLARPAA